jgi:hypothetical protein
MKNKIVALFIITVLTLSSNTIGKTIIQDKDIETGFISQNIGANWTVMYYMCCDSNMCYYGEPLLENLSKIGSKNDFNLVALYDGIPNGDSKIIYFNETGKKINLNEKIGWPNEVDYSNPLTFEKFISDMMYYYPAKYYAFITYASGGTGWQLYGVHDSWGTFNKTIKKGSSGFSTPRLGEALKYITKNGEEKIDVIHTSCAMNTIELAYEVASYVDYMVGTQDCLSSDFIYRYYQSVWELHNNTDWSPDEFSKYSSDILKPKSFYYKDEWLGGLRKINKFFNSLPYKKLQTVKHNDNIGVINNSNINELINSVDNLSRFLILNIKDEKIYKDIRLARQNSRESSKCFAKPGRSALIKFLHRQFSMNFTAYDGVVDLYDFCEKLRDKTDNYLLKAYCEDVMQNINKSVPYINKVQTDPIHGFNIYFPLEKKTYNAYVLSGEIPAKYEELGFSKNTAWDEFLKSYLNI